MAFSETAILNISVKKTAGFSATIKQVRNDLKNLNAQIKNVVPSSTSSSSEKVVKQLKKLRLDSKKATQEFKKLAKAMGQVTVFQQKLIDKINKGSIANKKNQKSIKDTGGALTVLKARQKGGIEGFVSLALAQARFAAGGIILFGIMSRIASAFNRVIERSVQLARVTTVFSGTVAETIARQKELNDIVTRVTGTLGTTITETSNALFELGSAGLSVKESIAALEPVMNLAIGTVANMGATAKAVAGLFKIFGDSIPGTEVDKFTRITDVLAAAFKNSLVETQDLIQGFRFFGNTAVTAGFSIEQTTAVLATLNDNLIKSGQAGRTARAALLQLIIESDKVRAAFGTTFEIGEFESFRDFLIVLRDKLNDVDKTVRDSALSDLGRIFGRQATPSIIALAENLDDLDKNLVGLGSAAIGTAEAFRKIQTESLAGQIKILNQNFLNVAEGGLSVIGAGIRQVLLVITPLIRSLSELNKATGSVVPTILLVTAALTVFNIIVRKVLLSVTLLNTLGFTKLAANAEFAQKGINASSVAMLAYRGNVGKLAGGLAAAGVALKGFLIIAAAGTAVALAGVALLKLFIFASNKMKGSITERTKATEKSTEELEANIVATSKNESAQRKLLDTISEMNIELIKSQITIANGTNIKDIDVDKNIALVNSILGISVSLDRSSDSFIKSGKDVNNLQNDLSEFRIELQKANDTTLSGEGISFGDVDTSSLQELIGAIDETIDATSKLTTSFDDISDSTNNVNVNLNSVITNSDDLANAQLALLSATSNYNIKLDASIESGVINIDQLQTLTQRSQARVKSLFDEAAALALQAQRTKLVTGEAKDLFEALRRASVVSQIPVLQQQIKDLNAEIEKSTGRADDIRSIGLSFLTVAEEAANSAAHIKIFGNSFGSVGNAFAEFSKNIGESINFINSFDTSEAREELQKLGPEFIQAIEDSKGLSKTLFNLISTFGGLAKAQKFFGPELELAFTSLGEEGKRLKEKLLAIDAIIKKLASDTIKASESINRFIAASKASSKATIDLINIEKEFQTLIAERASALAGATNLGGTEESKIRNQIALQEQLTKISLDAVTKRQAASLRLLQEEIAAANVRKELELKGVKGQENAALLSLKIEKKFDTQFKESLLKRQQLELASAQEIITIRQNASSATTQLEVDALTQIAKIRKDLISDNLKIDNELAKQREAINKKSQDQQVKDTADAIEKIKQLKANALAAELSSTNELEAARRGQLEGEEKLAAIQGDFKKQLGGSVALSLELSGVDAAKAGLEAARAIIRELPTEAIISDGKITTSAEELTDIKIALLRKAAQASHEISANELSLVEDAAAATEQANKDAAAAANTTKEDIADKAKQANEDVADVAIGSAVKAQKAAQEAANIQIKELIRVKDTAGELVSSIDDVKTELLGLADSAVIEAIGSVAKSLAAIIEPDAETKLTNYIKKLIELITRFKELKALDSGIPEIPDVATGGAGDTTSAAQEAAESVKTVAREAKQANEEASASAIESATEIQKAAQETSGVQIEEIGKTQEAAKEATSDLTDVRTALLELGDSTIIEAIDSVAKSLAEIIEPDGQAKLEDYIEKIIELIKQFKELTALGFEFPDIPGGGGGGGFGSTTTEGFGGTTPGFGGTNIGKSLSKLGELNIPKDVSVPYGQATMNALRKQLIPPGFLGSQNLNTQSSDAFVINITPDVIRSTKDMDEDELRKFTKKLVKHFKSELSKTDGRQPGV